MNLGSFHLNHTAPPRRTTACSMAGLPHILAPAQADSTFGHSVLSVDSPPLARRGLPAGGFPARREAACPILLSL